MIGVVDESLANRAFSWLLVLLIVTGAFFGLAPFLAPTQFAALFGFAGVDVFLYREAGSATFANSVGLALGYRASWVELRVPIAATAVFYLGWLIGCAVVVAAGGAQPVVYVILLVSLIFTPACLFYVARPPVRRAAAPAHDAPLAPWVSGLYVVGAAAALFFGATTLALGASFGRALGYPGMDDFVYRQGGAATLGAAVGAVLVLLDRRWATARVPTIMALAFNGAGFVAAGLEISTGTAQPIAYVILAAAGLVTLGSALALYRNGR
jgi:hypothetical protein